MMKLTLNRFQRKNADQVRLDQPPLATHVPAGTPLAQKPGSSLQCTDDYQPIGLVRPRGGFIMGKGISGFPADLQKSASWIDHNLGDGGGTRTLLHEIGHALDFYLSTDGQSSGAAFQRAYKADMAALKADDLTYYLQPPPAGAEEAFAQSFAWYRHNPELAQRYPNLFEYWERVERGNFREIGA